MSSKTKAECKVPVLKGQEGLFHYVSRDDMLTPTKAEDKMNRPFGAVDVAANLKGAVPKAAAQKILVALSEKGLLTQKTYGKSGSNKSCLYAPIHDGILGKTTFFVVNQLSIESVPKEVLAVLEAEQKLIDEENKMLAADIKAMQSGIFSATPSDREVEAQINEAGKTVSSKFENFRRCHYQQV
ncbi:hypothetical protein H0H92_013753 [Tricholoma furcatifolium]|nr:hypothetical protein H0H92_013753 [Tricholoma furcatifolium]